MGKKEERKIWEEEKKEDWGEEEKKVHANSQTHDIS